MCLRDCLDSLQSLGNLPLCNVQNIIVPRIRHLDEFNCVRMASCKFSTHLYGDHLIIDSVENGNSCAAFGHFCEMMPIVKAVEIEVTQRPAKNSTTHICHAREG